MNNHPYKLVQTCAACPEQYDVFLNDQQVGYLRLNHGYFTVRYPDSSGDVIFEAEPSGDCCFQQSEREDYLKEAITAIDKKINSVTTNPARTIEASHFLGTIEANLDNDKLSDKDFRELIRNTLPIVKYNRPKNKAPSQPKEDNSDCIINEASSRVCSKETKCCISEHKD